MHLNGLIYGKVVRIRADKTDRYGRWLCDVWLINGADVTGRMREFLKDYPELDKYKRLY